MTSKHQPEPTFREALAAVLEYLWDDEKRACDAVPLGERPKHIFASLRVLERQREATLTSATSDRLAWAAVRQLLDAYARGEEEGGSIDWDDLDVAHELACDAVAAQVHDVAGGRAEEDAAHASARAELLTLARYFVAIANPDYGAYDLNEALTHACTLAGLVLGFDRLSRTPETGRALDRSTEDTCQADYALGRLREVAARLVDDDDHDCDLTEELGVACEMATLFQELDTALSGGAPVPKAWRSALGRS